MDRRTETAARAALLRTQDRMFAEVFAGYSATTGTTAATAPAPLTTGRLLDLAATMPPRETWCICGLFPPGKVTVCKTPGETFYLAGRALMRRVAVAWQETLTAEQRANPLYGFSATEIDPVASDDAGTAIWRTKERKRVLDAMAGTVAAEVELSRVFAKR